MPDQPIPRKVTRWICPHCTRGWASRRRAAEHIGICYRNPANRSCKTCTHWHSGYPGDYGTPAADEVCLLGVPLPDHPIRDGRKLLILHCGRWEANT